MTACVGEIPVVVLLPMSYCSGDGLLSGSPDISLFCLISGSLLIAKGSVSGILSLRLFRSGDTEGVYLASDLGISPCELVRISPKIDCLLGREEVL